MDEVKPLKRNEILMLIGIIIFYIWMAVFSACIFDRRTDRRQGIAEDLQGFRMFVLGVLWPVYWAGRVFIWSTTFLVDVVEPDPWNRPTPKVEK